MCLFPRVARHIYACYLLRHPDRYPSAVSHFRRRVVLLCLAGLLLPSPPSFGHPAGPKSLVLSLNMSFFRFPVDKSDQLLTHFKVPVNSRVFTVGRLSTTQPKHVNYTINHYACSLYHFKISVNLFEEGDPNSALYAISDYGSTNGTFVNGKDLRQIGDMLLTSGVRSNTPFPLGSR